MNPVISPEASGDPTCARLLLEAGADPNAQEKYGDTALISAAKDDLIPMVELLLLHPAIDVSIPGFGGETAVQQAQKAGRARIVEMLLAHKPTVVVTDSVRTLWMPCALCLFEFPL
jgi:ankyrin repeat protein